MAGLMLCPILPSQHWGAHWIFPPAVLENSTKKEGRVKFFYQKIFFLNVSILSALGWVVEKRVLAAKTPL